MSYPFGSGVMPLATLL